MVVFRNRGHWGNCVYIDNVNIGNNTSSVANPATMEQPYIYPNPVSPGSCLNGLLPEGKYLLTIYDINGKTIHSENIGSGFKWDIGNEMPSGLYTINIRGEKTIWNRKIIVK
jgi:hypothetical protein